MSWLEATAAAAMGAAALSFVQVTVDRAGTGAGLLERSRCSRCRDQLRPVDVLPAAGFLLLRGRCRGCRSPTPPRHLAGELAAAALWAAAVALLGGTEWLPVVLLAPLMVLLLWSREVRSGGVRLPVAAALPPVGVALLTFEVVWLLEGRWAAYAAGGLLGAGALAAGAIAARRDTVGVVSSAGR